LARGLRLVGQTSPRALDHIASFGERCCARTVAAALRQGGVLAVAVDALEAVEGVPVVTGFIGADEQGNIPTLGRNGSDYSAALFGVAVAAAEIQIWKDVDGI